MATGTRNSNKMGTIYQRKDGRWCAQVRLGFDVNGKPQRPTIYADTEAEIVDKLKQLLHDDQQGLAPKSGRLTVAAFLTTWLQNSVRHTVKPNTYTGYESAVRVHIAPALGRKTLAKLQPSDVQGMLRSKLEAGLSARTVNNMRIVLRRSLNQAVKWGLVARNAAALSEPIPESKHRCSPFTPNQARALLQAVRGDRLAPAYELALATGLRRGELLGLRWSDLDLAAGTLQVKVSLQRTRGTLELRDPKSEKSRRTLHLATSLVTSLQSHKAMQIDEARTAGIDWQQRGLVFTTRYGTPIEPRNFNRHFETLCARADLPRKRVHDLRHTAASLMLAAGIPLHVVSKTLGHSSVSITADIYGHLYDPDRQRVADVMEGYLWGAGS